MMSDFSKNCVCVSSGTCTCTPWQYLTHVGVRLSGSCIDSIPEIMSAFRDNYMLCPCHTCTCIYTLYLNSTWRTTTPFGQNTSYMYMYMYMYM